MTRLVYVVDLCYLLFSPRTIVDRQATYYAILRDIAVFLFAHSVYRCEGPWLSSRFLSDFILCHKNTMADIHRKSQTRDEFIDLCLLSNFEIR